MYICFASSFFEQCINVSATPRGSFLTSDFGRLQVLWHLVVEFEAERHMDRGDIFGSSPFPVPPKSLTDPLLFRQPFLHMLGAGSGLGGTSARILLIYVLA